MIRGVWPLFAEHNTYIYIELQFEAEFSMNLCKGAFGLLCILVLTIPWRDCWAEPFGFEYGMTKDEITALIGRHSLVKVINGNVYEFSTAPRPYKAFELYLLMISPQKGL